MSVIRTSFENNNEIGVFSKLTNAYCLVGIGGSANFYRWPKTNPLKLHLIILLQCIRVRVTRCHPCGVHLDSRLQDNWEDDGEQHSSRKRIMSCPLVFIVSMSPHLSSRWATDTGCWCRAPPRTRSCSRSGTRSQTPSASRGWRSDSPPSATSWVGPEVNTVQCVVTVDISASKRSIRSA